MVWRIKEFPLNLIWFNFSVSVLFFFYPSRHFLLSLHPSGLQIGFLQRMRFLLVLFLMHLHLLIAPSTIWIVSDPWNYDVEQDLKYWCILRCQTSVLHVEIASENCHQIFSFYEKISTYMFIRTYTVDKILDFFQPTQLFGLHAYLAPQSNLLFFFD